jgi:hypothetical protein
VNIVNDSEVFVMFVTLDGEDPTRNISESHKIFKSWGVWKKSKGRNRKNIINVYLREGFRGK